MILQLLFQSSLSCIVNSLSHGLARAQNAGVPTEQRKYPRCNSVYFNDDFPCNKFLGSQLFFRSRFKTLYFINVVVQYLLACEDNDFWFSAKTFCAQGKLRLFGETMTPFIKAYSSHLPLTDDYLGALSTYRHRYDWTRYGRGRGEGGGSEYAKVNNRTYAS